MPYRSIKIEKKHVYHNINTYFNYGIDSSNCCLVFDPYYPTAQGTQSDQRIGDKIRPTSFILDMVLQHSYNQGTPFANETYTPGYTYSGSLTNGTGSISVPNTLTGYKPNHDWYSQFRVFLIQTEPDEVLFDSAINAKHWFLDNFVPYVLEDGATQAVTNNQIDLLRESTADTGSYKIVWDYKFTLTNKKPMKHINKTFPINKTFSFEKDTGTVPTNVRYSFVILGPINNINYDYSLVSEFTSGINVNVKAVVKTNYLDE